MKVSINSMKKLNWLYFQDKINLKLYIIIFSCLFLCFFFLIQYYKLKKIKFKHKITETQNLLKELKIYIKETDYEMLEILSKIKNELNFTGNKKNLNLVHSQIFSLLILGIIIEQKKQLKTINTSESLEICLHTDKIIGSGDVFSLKKQINENYKWLKEYEETKKNIENTILKLQNGLLIRGTTDIIIKKLQRIQKEFSTLKLEDVKRMKSELLAIFYSESSNESLNLIRDEIDNLQVSLEGYTLFEKHIIYIREYLEEHYYLSNYSEILWELLYNLKQIKKQIKVLSILKNINDLCMKYKKNTDYINEENNLKIDKKIIKNLYSETNKKNSEIAHKIDELLSVFFMSLPSPDLSLITDILKINNFNSQNAKILVLLLADKKIKRTIIPGILDVYSNLNPVVSRLINDRIKSNEKSIEEFKNTNPFSIISSLISDLSK